MIVLDTHVWVWLAGKRHDELSADALAAIEQSDVFGVSAVSCWEVSLLVSRGRLKVDRGVRDWIEDALSQPKVRVIPLSMLAAFLAGNDRFWSDLRDPGDRMIAATAVTTKSSLVTKDERLHRQNNLQFGVGTIW